MTFFEWVVRHFEQFLFLLFVLGGLLAPLFRNKSKEPTRNRTERGASEAMDEETLARNLRRQLGEMAANSQAQGQLSPRRAPAAAPTAPAAPARMPKRQPRPRKQLEPTRLAEPATSVASPLAPPSLAASEVDQRQRLRPEPGTARPRPAARLHMVLRGAGLRQGVLLKEILDP